MFRKTQISIQLCQTCHQHPELNHNQALYQERYLQIQQQIEKKDDNIRLTKKQNFRKGAFQIWMDHLLLYSKLNNPQQNNNNQILIRAAQLSIIISCIINRSSEDINKLKIKMIINQKKSQVNPNDKNKVDQQKLQVKKKRPNFYDLYSYVRSKYPKLRLTMKMFNSQIENILKQDNKTRKQFLCSSRKQLKTYRKSTFKQNNNNLSKNIQISVLQTSRFIENSNKLTSSIKRHSKFNNCDHQTNCDSHTNQILFMKSSKRGNTVNSYLRSNRNYQKNMHSLKSRIYLKSASIDYKIDYPHNGSGIGISKFKDAVNCNNLQPSKKINYTYLSDQMDKNECSLTKKQEFFHTQKRVLIFSRDEEEQKQSGITNEKIVLLELSQLQSQNRDDQTSSQADKSNQCQNIQDIKKREGLVLNIPKNIIENYNKKIGTPTSQKRKYSFQFNRDFQNIQKELKSQFGEKYKDNRTPSVQALTLQKIDSEESEVHKKNKSVKIQNASQQSCSSSVSFDLVGKKSHKHTKSQKNKIAFQQIQNNSRKIMKSNKSLCSLMMDTVTENVEQVVAEEEYEHIYGEIMLKSEIFQTDQSLTSSYQSGCVKLCEINDEKFTIIKLSPTKFTNFTNINFAITLFEESFHLFKRSISNITLQTIIMDIFLIEKVYPKQFQQIFSIQNYQKISLEGCLYNQAMNKQKKDTKKLEQIINLDQNFIKFRLFDCHQGTFLNFEVSLAMMKKCRQYIRQVIRSLSMFSLEKQLYDWTTLIIIGYSVINSWKKYYYIQGNSVQINGFLDEEILKQRRQNQLINLLKIINNSPSIQINLVDVRKIKRVLLDGCFAGKTTMHKGKLFLMPKKKMFQTQNKNSGNTSPQVRLLTDFNVNKSNILKSKAIIINPSQKIQSQSSSEQIQLFYQQLALKFEKVMISFHCDQSFTQLVVQKNQVQQIHHNPVWKIIFVVNKSHEDQKNNFQENNLLRKKTERLIFQFFQFLNELQSKDKPTKVTISQINRKMKHGKQKLELQSIGQINKRGTFFFQLDLQPGQYICEIFREYDKDQVNSLKIISSSLVNIAANAINLQNGKKYCNNHIQGLDLIKYKKPLIQQTQNHGQNILECFGLK